MHLVHNALLRRYGGRARQNNQSFGRMSPSFASGSGSAGRQVHRASHVAGCCQSVGLGVQSEITQAGTEAFQHGARPPGGDLGQPRRVVILGSSCLSFRKEISLFQERVGFSASLREAGVLPRRRLHAGQRRDTAGACPGDGRRRCDTSAARGPHRRPCCGPPRGLGQGGRELPDLLPCAGVRRALSGRHRSRPERRGQAAQRRPGVCERRSGRSRPCPGSSPGIRR